MQSGRALDGEHICRVCLEHKPELFLIFDEAFGEAGSPMSHILSECTRYKVERYDTLPHQMCEDCMGAARHAYRFKRQAETAYRKLLDLLGVDVAAKMAVAMGKDYIDNCTQTEKYSIYPCELCGEKFFDAADLKAHRQEIHKGMAKVCRVCNKTFDRLRQLQSHLAHEHPDEGLTSGIECRVCQRRFSRRDHLKRHLRNIHNLDWKGARAAALEEEPEIDVKQSADSLLATAMHTTNWQSCGEEATDLDDDYDDGALATTNPISSDDEDIEHKMSNDSMIWPLLKLEPELEIKVEPNSVVNMDHSNSANPTKLKQEHIDEDNADTAERNADVDADDDDDYVDGDNDMGADDDDAEEEDTRITRSGKSAPGLKKPKVEIVREYLERKEGTKRRRKGETEENRCSKCLRTFSRHCHLQRHMLTHSEEKHHACPNCPKRFARSDHLKAHIVSVHNDKEFKCDQCSYAFARLDALIRHKDMRHSADGNAASAYKIHPCEYCDKKFVSKTYLQKHILMHTDRIFACRHCEETFRDRKEFRAHEKTHQTGRKYLCSMCGESFMRNDYLRVHMRRHTGEKPYKCKYCDKAFPRATDLNIHVRYHTGNKPNLCNLCGKGFHRAYNLTIHMRTHTGERPFKCDQCPKSFAQSNDLKSHKRRHTGERYKCNTCDAAFLQLYGLRQHALSVHGIHIESTTGRLQKFLPLTPAQTIATPIDPTGPAPPIATPVAAAQAMATLPIPAPPLTIPPPPAVALPSVLQQQLNEQQLQQQQQQQQQHQQHLDALQGSLSMQILQRMHTL